MKLYRILVLEDNLDTLSIIMGKLLLIQRTEGNEKGIKIAVTVMSEHTQVEQMVNPNDAIYDLILLDRDCCAGGSFHVLDFKKFNPDHIISISTVPEYNEEARRKGVKIFIRKNFSRLEEFGDELSNLIKRKIFKNVYFS